MPARLELEVGGHALQVAGTACATAGFVIATRWFNVPYNMVQYNHGALGIATLALVYSQVCTGVQQARLPCVPAGMLERCMCYHLHGFSRCTCVL